MLAAAVIHRGIHGEWKEIIKIGKTLKTFKASAGSITRVPTYSSA